MAGPSPAKTAGGMFDLAGDALIFTVIPAKAGIH
jgi:hypothetical protein